MASLRDHDIVQYLLDESNEDADEPIEPEDDCEPDQISSHSDHSSEEDAEEGILRRHQDEYIGKDGTKWAKQPVRLSTKITRENIITEPFGVRHPYKDKKSHVECFDLFISEEILIVIFLHTNEKIRYSNLLNNRREDPTTAETTIIELKALFGLLFLAGLFRSGRQNTNDLWRSDGTGIEIFRMTMSRNRFTFLLNNLRYDAILSRNERAAIDRITPVREIFELFVQNCKKVYSPSEYLTLDEELIAFRGRCGFRQYIPSKPAKYGIKVYSLVDSKTFYTQHLEIYCGKQSDNSPYKVSNKPLDVVDRMVLCVSGSSRNITMDNFFTSYETAVNLLENHKLTVVGTLRSNKTCIPQKFKTKREETTSIFGFQKDVTLVSYVPKPRRMVYLLSTLHHEAEIDENTGAQKKPAIITFYNETKSGVDVVDKLARTFDVSRNSKRWPLTIFFSLLNHAGINAMIIYLLNNGIEKKTTDTRRKFIRQLGLSLIEQHLKERKENKRIKKSLRQKLRQHFGETEFEPTPGPSNSKRRCLLCPRTKDRKTKHRCEKCKVPICLEHCHFTCGKCEVSSGDDSD